MTISKLSVITPYMLFQLLSGFYVCCVVFEFLDIIKHEVFNKDKNNMRSTQNTFFPLLHGIVVPHSILIVYIKFKFS